jgi:hypothetical protein
VPAYFYQAHGRIQQLDLGFSSKATREAEVHCTNGASAAEVGSGQNKSQSREEFACIPVV